MSELEKTDGSAEGVPGSDGTDAVTAGRMIREAREASGLHIGALSVAMKVPVSKLEALEDGRLAALSGPVFARALASSVCRALKVDSENILKRLPRPHATQLHQMTALNEPFRGESGGSRIRVVEKLGKPSMIAVAALLAGVVILFFLPELRALLPDQKRSPGPDTSQSAEVPTRMSPASSPTEPLPAMSTGSADKQSQGSDGPTQSPAPVVGLRDGAGLLAFQASAPSWVEVTDANGAVVLRKTLAAGEALQVGGVPPLKVVVGRADAIEVTIRGKRIALQEWSKDNVARFEVK